jgi:hypothetical protein
LYRLWSSLFHLGRQHSPSCVRPYILRDTKAAHVRKKTISLKMTNSWGRNMSEQ